MTRNSNNNQAPVQEQIRRQLGSAEMARFLNALPSFQVDDNIPDDFQVLLGKLDRAEMRSRKN